MTFGAGLRVMLRIHAETISAVPVSVGGRTFVSVPRTYRSPIKELLMSESQNAGTLSASVPPAAICSAWSGMSSVGAGP